MKVDNTLNKRIIIIFCSTINLWPITSGVKNVKIVKIVLNVNGSKKVNIW